MISNQFYISAEINQIIINNNEIRSELKFDGNTNNIEISYGNYRYGDSIITLLDSQNSYSAIFDVDNYILKEYMQKHNIPLIDLLQIQLYEHNCPSDYQFYQGFLGKINNITLNISDGEFIFGNGYDFDVGCFNPEKNNQCKNFDIFITRYLPFLLEENRFSKLIPEKIEEFIYNFR